jgi:hypothetical protein
MGENQGLLLIYIPIEKDHCIFLIYTPMGDDHVISLSYTPTGEDLVILWSIHQWRVIILSY